MESTMSSVRTSIEDIQQPIRDVVRFHSGLFLAQGLIMTLLGVAAVIWPQISSLAVDVYLGWIFLFSGGMGLGMMFFAPNVGGFLWSLLTGALALFVGVLLLWHPVEGVVSLTLVLVAFFIVEGVFQIAAAVGYRSAFPESWSWMLGSGIADLILAGLIIAGWPSSAGWVLGLFVGVNLITSGVAIIVAAAAARRAVAMVENAAR
jgi:uncharacterized membrane protein HdeD (DUF308 family)